MFVAGKKDERIQEAKEKYYHQPCQGDMNLDYY
jgi:hypothetical protein